MITQRELDIGQIEAKMKAQKLFDEWRAAYIGSRAGAKNGSRTGDGRSRPEDSQAASAENQGGGIGNAPQY